MMRLMKRRSGFGETEDDDIAPLRGSHHVGQPVHHHELPIVQTRLHAVPFHPDAGGDQVDHHEEQRGEQHRLHHTPQEVKKAPHQAWPARRLDYRRQGGTS
jgi:hypothetical protein